MHVKVHRPFSFIFICEAPKITIQHASIPDAQRHEPKGASTATVNSVYSSNGAGSGTWTKVVSQMMQGVAGDSGNANQKLITDGAGGFKLRRDAVYGAMTITNNANGFTVSAAADSSLNTNSDYVLLTGTGAPWASESLSEVTFNTNRLIAPVTGVYEVLLWANIVGYPTNTSSVAVKYRVNGTTFGPRKVKTKSNSAGDAGALSAFGLTSLTANDFVQLCFASTAAGSLIIGDLNLTLRLVQQTA